MPEKLNLEYLALKDLLSNSKTGEVLEILKTSLATQSDYQNFHNEVILLAADFSNLTKAKRIDILRQQDYNIKQNQINHSILEILDDLAEGKKLEQSKERVNVLPFWRLILPVLGVVILAFGASIGVFYKIVIGKPSGINPLYPIVPAEKWLCPEFKAIAGYKILVAPFHDNLPPGVVAPHKHLITNLSDFKNTERLDVQILTFQNDEDIHSLSSEDEAKRIGVNCKSDIIVWGSSYLPSNGKASITTNYIFLAELWLNRISDIQEPKRTIVDLSSISEANDFKKATEELERVLKILIAYENGNSKLVAELSKTKINHGIEPGEEPNIPLTLLAADSYTKLGNTEKAIEAYSTVLSIDPTNTLALNNRGLLLFKEKEYEKALLDYTSLSNLDTNDFEAFFKKAKINEKLGNLGAAKKDIERAEKLSPLELKSEVLEEKKTIDIKLYDLEKEEVRNIAPIQPGVNVIEGSITDKPSNVIGSPSNKLLESATANNKVGNFKVAEESAVQILKQKPTNQAALNILVESLYNQNNKLTIKDLQKYPSLKNMDATMLKRFDNTAAKQILLNENLAKSNFKVVHKMKIKTN